MHKYAYRECCNSQYTHQWPYLTNILVMNSIFIHRQEVELNKKKNIITRKI